MSEKKCSLAECQRQSHGSCHGCHLDFCREHLFEHALSIHLQLNPLIDDVNKMNGFLKTFDRNDFRRSTYEKLEQWRKKSHQLIDIYFTEKTKNLDNFIDDKLRQYDEELTEIQTKIVAHKREQETTHEQIDLLTFQIENLHRHLDTLKPDRIPIQIKSLTIDENLINFEESFDISSLPPIHRVIDRDDQSYTSLATDNKLLLLYHEGTLLLVDKTLTISKQIPWRNGDIYDMCYSHTLKRFLILVENELYSLDETNMSITKIRSIPWQQCFSCSCSDKCLYLSTKVYNSSLMQFDLLPSITFVKKWPSNEICTDDEGIDGICCQNQTIALMISNEQKKLIRLDLYSTVSMKRIWTINFDVIYNPNQAFRFCSINRNEWLVADHANCQLIQVSADGKVKAIVGYELPPCCVIQIAKDMLAVSTESVVHLHKL